MGILRVKGSYSRFLGRIDETRIVSKKMRWIVSNCNATSIKCGFCLEERTFLEMLTYKADLYGKTFITVNPTNTTPICHDCSFVMGTKGTDKLTLADRECNCPHCGVHNP